MLMPAFLAPHLSGGHGTVSVAAWNIRCGEGKRSRFATKGLVKMGVRCAVLLEMKITGNCYTHMMLGYKVLLTKALSKHQEGIALLWQPDYKAFEIEARRL
jgi:hypothetical protein